MHELTSESLPPTPPDSDEDITSADKFPLPPASIIPTKVLDPDKNTPDHHVPRDPRLIRLTGVHPFNVEPPLTALFEQGFLTSPELFYVRNHGAVPEVLDHDVLDWTFSVEGLVERPIEISVRDLINDYENITCPISLVCAGNRRKEQNVVRKSKGFSWGPSGVSTALFTGVAMWDVIKRAKPTRRAKYVCMEGSDKLPNGCYGTSLKLNWVRDPNRGIMLAHGMNGEPLRPDHGKPLRAVVPGQIGARSVKWLKKLVLTHEPSDNWYHYYDNRVLPTMISPEVAANNPKWWMDERYAIYDLSPNSVIACPAHEEQLCLVGAPDVYRLRGYAYGGGGRRITRVEISLDKGRNWLLTEIDYPEDAYRDLRGDVDYGGGRIDMQWRETCFCWCFWTLDVAVKELECAGDILVRCMDEGMAMQPRDMYWSVLGMMNNPWFRVTISKEDNFLRFEHPTQPALMPGGWMERVKKQGGNLLDGYWGESMAGKSSEAVSTAQAEVETEIKMTKEDIKRVITIDEIRKHDGAEEPWFIVHGEVFDGTAFLNDHPGGAQSIISSAGLDSSDEFMAIHSETAKAMMPDYHIGTIDEKTKAALAESEVAEQTSPGQRPIFLSPRIWTKAVLESKQMVSSDTRVLRFKLEHDEQALGLPTGQHLMIRLTDPATREAIIRPYTPISEEDRMGFIDVLVKVYFDSEDRKGGRMSQALDAIPVGHGVDFKGPIGKFVYKGNGVCTVNERERTVTRFVMICAGSGVTPIFQVFRRIMMNGQDQTSCVVLNGNRRVEDILCKDDLDLYADKGKQGKGKVLYTLTQGPEDWQGLRGRIAAPLIEEHCPCAGQPQMALICGPEAMEKTVHAALKEQGWKDEDLLFF